MSLGSFSFSSTSSKVSCENMSLSQGNQRKESWLWTSLQLACRGGLVSWGPTTGVIMETKLKPVRCIGPSKRRSSPSPTSHFRIKGFVIYFKIKRAISLCNSICYWNFSAPTQDHLVTHLAFRIWITVNPRWELLYQIQTYMPGSLS